MGTLTASGTSHGPAAPIEDLHHLILRVLGKVLDRVHQGLRPHVPVAHQDLDFLFSPTVLVPSSERTSGSKRKDRATSEDPRKVARNVSRDSLAMPRRA